MANDQKEQKSLSLGGTPIFAGKTALIRFVNAGDSNSSSIWLAERDPKVIRPFVSEEFFDSMFANPQQAQKAVVTMSSDELGPEGMFKDFKVLDEEHAVQPDGSMKPLQFSPSQIQKRYGQPINPEAENNALTELDGMFSRLSEDPNAQPQSPGGPQPMGVETGAPTTPEMAPPQGVQGIPAGAGGPGSGAVYNGRGGPGSGAVYDGKGAGPSTLHTFDATQRDSALESRTNTMVKNMLTLAGDVQENGKDAPQKYFEDLFTNDEAMGFYIGAIAYGGYKKEDVYADMVRVYKADKDKTLLTKIIIDPEVKKSTYIKTEAGKAGQATAKQVIPATSTFGKILATSSTDRFGGLAVSGMTEGIFTSPYEQRDATSESFKADAAKIKEVWWDGFVEKIKANTIAEDAIADNTFKDVNTEIEKRYGIKMSADSKTAEQQLKNLDKSASMSGALGGEEYTRARDAIQRAAGEAAQIDRDAMKTEKESKEYEKILASGTPAEIAAYISAHPDKAGVFKVPQTMLDKFNDSQMAADYPLLTADQRKELRDTYFDENGNRRSTIWQKYYDDYHSSMSSMRSQQKEDQSIKDTEEYNKWLKDNGRQPATDFAGKPILDKNGNPTYVKTNTDNSPSTYDQQMEPDKPGVGTGETPPTGSTYTAKPAPTVSIQKGSTDQTSIKQLQDYLVDQGYMLQTDVDGGYGSFGPKTTAALTAWQKANGVGDASSWGNWGPQSMAKAPTAVATPNRAQEIADLKKTKDSVVNPNAANQQNMITSMQNYANNIYSPDGTMNYAAYEAYQKQKTAYEAEIARQKAIETKANSLIGKTDIDNYIATLSPADADIVRRAKGVINAGPTQYSNLAQNVQTYNAPQLPPPPQITQTPTSPAGNSGSSQVSSGQTDVQRAAANAAAGLSSAQISAVNAGQQYTPAKTTPTQYSSLSEYLTKTTGSYDPYASSAGRQALAKKYGYATGYTGTGEQNTSILAKINQGL